MTNEKRADEKERLRGSLLWNWPCLISAGVGRLLESLDHSQYTEFLFSLLPPQLTRRVKFDHTHFPSARSRFAKSVRGT